MSIVGLFVNPVVLVTIGTYGTIALIILLIRRRNKKENEKWRLVREYLKAKGYWPEFPRFLPREDEASTKEMQALEEKEHRLRETKKLKFKFRFLGRLLWTYTKSVLGFFMPNVSIFFVAGIVLGVLAPNNIPKDWYSLMFLGSLFVFCIWGAIIIGLRMACESFSLHFSLWAKTAILFGIASAIPYVLFPSDDPRFFLQSYFVFTFAIVPLVFMFRRAKIILEEIYSLKSEIEKKKKFEKSMGEKGLQKFVDRHGHEHWGTMQQVTEWERIDTALRNNFADYSPREFEKFIARLFKKMGYEVRLGPYVGDYGVDIIAQKDDRRILIQVKKYARGHLVGNREVRDALGAIWGKADKAIIITTSDFTEQAYEQAKDAPIELWNHRTLENFVGKYFIGATKEKVQRNEDAKNTAEEETINTYKETFPELSEEELELQKTQEIDMDFEDENNF